MIVLQVAAWMTPSASEITITDTVDGRNVGTTYVVDAAGHVALPDDATEHAARLRADLGFTDVDLPVPALEPDPPPSPVAPEPEPVPEPEPAPQTEN